MPSEPMWMVDNPLRWKLRRQCPDSGVIGWLGARTQKWQGSIQPRSDFQMGLLNPLPGEPSSSHLPWPAVLPIPRVSLCVTAKQHRESCQVPDSGDTGTSVLMQTGMKRLPL